MCDGDVYERMPIFPRLFGLYRVAFGVEVRVVKEQLCDWLEEVGICGHRDVDQSNVSVLLYGQ